MNLAQLIIELQNQGNRLTNYSGVETNVQSVRELEEYDGKFYLNLTLNPKTECVIENDPLRCQLIETANLIGE